MRAEQPCITRPQVAEATARYLASGSVITCLPDGPTVRQPDVLLSEKIVRELQPVPWSDLIAAPAYSSEFQDQQRGPILGDPATEVSRTPVPADFSTNPTMRSCEGLVITAAPKIRGQGVLPFVTEGFSGKTSVEG
jgi:hypothetical protein